MKECVEHSIYIPLLRLLVLGSRAKVYDVLHDVTPMFSCSNVNVCVSMQWKFSDSKKKRVYDGSFYVKEDYSYIP